MTAKKLFSIKTISEYHKLAGLPKPEHPLISVVNFDNVQHRLIDGERNTVFDFYAISIKRSSSNKYKYGQQHYDFDEGVMYFMAPNQIFGVETGENVEKPSGW